MNQRTYEIISKWVAETSGVSITFEEGACPHANPKEKTIVLPTNIEANDPWAALSTLVHEAAHIKHSSNLPKNLSRNAVRHNILNAIEDIRIDQKNFLLMPNVFQWYDRSAAEQTAERAKIDMTKVSREKKILINGIYECERMYNGMIYEPDIVEFGNKNNVALIMQRGAYAIDGQNWNYVEQIQTELITLLGLDDPEDDPNSGGYVVGVPAGGEAGDGDGKEVLDISGLIAGLDKAFKSAPGDGTSAGSQHLGVGVINDLTKHKFKELLNVKEKKLVYEGNNLNHDNLILFHTGEIEELFLDDDIVKKKKSKMMFLIDASGSMDEALLCGNSRKSVTLGTVRHLVSVLRDVMSEDSLDVDYQIAAFTSDYHPLSKENWEREFNAVSGGTRLGTAFDKAMYDMMSDTTIDGSRIMVLFTDGDVDKSDVDKIDECIRMSGADIKYLMIGVGSDINSEYVLKVIGDNNILTKDTADMVLMDAIAGVI